MKNSLLITTLMLGASVATMAKATCTNNQTCGENCCWDLTGGVLTISGTGDMTDIPWRNQRDSITSVQISNGITSIADLAFRNASSLTSITIPDSVTSIGHSAFRNITGLTSITIPDSVTSIGNYAFAGATGLTSMTIPDSVTSIGDGAFRDATGLTSIVIGGSVTSIGNDAFAGATGLTSITIPDSVTSIGYYAFRDATGLTSINIPDTAALGGDLFNGLDLSNITIHCAGVLAQCQANMAAAGYADGTYNMEQAPYSKKQADGSRAYYDANGKLTGFTGKRIYTLDEANKITGFQNRVSIKYR